METEQSFRMGREKQALPWVFRGSAPLRPPRQTHPASIEVMPDDQRERLVRLASQEARSRSSAQDCRRETVALKYRRFQSQQTEACRKEKDRAERAHALQAFQPARSKEDLDALMQQPGAARILKNHLKALMHQEKEELSGYKLRDAGGASKTAYYNVYMACENSLGESDAHG